MSSTALSMSEALGLVPGMKKKKKWVDRKITDRQKEYFEH